MSKTAIYTGSFDPITTGHVDIVQRVHGLFDSFTIVVAYSSFKSYLFSIEERAELIRECFKGNSRIQVDCCKGLLAQYIRDNNVNLIIRGARSVSDFENELSMSNANKDTSPDCETLLAFTRSKYQHYSSRIVKEIALNGGDVSQYVPGHVQQALKQKYNSTKG